MHTHCGMFPLSDSKHTEMHNHDCIKYLSHPDPYKHILGVVVDLPIYMRFVLSVLSARKYCNLCYVALIKVQ